MSPMYFEGNEILKVDRIGRKCQPWLRLLPFGWFGGGSGEGQALRNRIAAAADFNRAPCHHTPGTVYVYRLIAYPDRRINSIPGLVAVRNA